MAELAKLLHAKGIVLKNPTVEQARQIARIEGKTYSSESDSEKEVSFSADNSPEPSDVPSDNSIASASDSSIDTKMPPSILKKKKGPSSDGLVSEDFSKLSLRDKTFSVVGNLPTPLLTGKWEEWDHDAEVMKTFILMRLCLHTSSKEDDFQLKWVNDTVFKIRVKWPIWMQKQLMMVNLDQDYQRGHKVYDNMGSNAKALKDNDNLIWSEGVFKFRNPMQKKTVEKIFFPEVDSDGNKGPVLQILFEEVTEEGIQLDFKSPQKTVGGAIQFSKLSTPLPKQSPSKHVAAPVPAPAIALKPKAKSKPVLPKPKPVPTPVSTLSPPQEPLQLPSVGASLTSMVATAKQRALSRLSAAAAAGGDKGERSNQNNKRPLD